MLDRKNYILLQLIISGNRINNTLHIKEGKYGFTVIDKKIAPWGEEEKIYMQSLL